MTINDWVKKCHEIAKNHGWWDEEKSLGECIAERSEALEEARAAAERAAAERAAAERAAATVWTLSDREKNIIESLEGQKE